MHFIWTENPLNLLLVFATKGYSQQQNCLDKQGNFREQNKQNPSPLPSSQSWVFVFCR